MNIYNNERFFERKIVDLFVSVLDENDITVDSIVKISEENDFQSLNSDDKAILSLLNDEEIEYIIGCFKFHNIISISNNNYIKIDKNQLDIVYKKYTKIGFGNFIRPLVHRKFNEIQYIN